MRNLKASSVGVSLADLPGTSARDRVVVGLAFGSWGSVCSHCAVPLSSGKSNMGCTGGSSCPACLRTWQEGLPLRCLSLLVDVGGRSLSFLLRFVMDTALERAVSFSTLVVRDD